MSFTNKTKEEMHLTLQYHSGEVHVIITLFYYQFTYLKSICQTFLIKFVDECMLIWDGENHEPPIYRSSIHYLFPLSSIVDGPRLKVRLIL